MATLTVTARGQVTFRKDVLQHLGVKPGEKIEPDLLPGGRADIAAKLLARAEAIAVAQPCLWAFADGVIAFEGPWLGGETCASFGKKAVVNLQRLS